MSGNFFILLMVLASLLLQIGADDPGATFANCKLVERVSIVTTDL